MAFSEHSGREYGAPGAAVCGRPGAWTLALLWLVVLAVSLSRSLFDPIGFDQAAWQYATERVMAGERMYVDVWDQNAPGVIGVHWLSTKLVGRSPLALRAFDALWQLATMCLLVGLAVRNGRHWSVGWLAAILYALAYYGTGYIHTAQRDGFAVLPMLLMLHAALGGVGSRGIIFSSVMGFIAGVMGFGVFAIKPPLGLCYGVVWLFMLGEGWKRRRSDVGALAAWLGLTLGFLVTAAGGIGWMMHLGWWSAFLQTMTRSEIPGYTKGPWMVRQLMPAVALTMLALAGMVAVIRRSRGSMLTRFEIGRLPEGLRVWAFGVFVCVVMLTVAEWTDWQPIALGLAGLWVPAVGSVMLCAWAGRSVAWRLVLLTAVAAAGAVVFQGRFFLYHFHPLIACASYLGAVGIVDACTCGSGRVAGNTAQSGAWRAVCLGMVAYLGIGFWGGRMVYYSSSPYLLSGGGLMEHYDRVTRHKSHYPLYSTSVRVAKRIQELTRPDESIACLLNEPRIYYLAERPAAHGMIIPNEAFRPKFASFIHTICDKQPPVVLARRPADVPVSADKPTLTRSVFAEAEAFFGSVAGLLREHYQVAEVVGDVCILRPLVPGAPR